MLTHKECNPERVVRNTPEMIPMNLIDLDIVKGKSRRQQNSWRPQPRAHGPLSGGCRGKGRCHCVDPGAIVEEIVKPYQPDFQKATDANQNNHDSLVHFNVWRQPRFIHKKLPSLGYIYYDATTSSWVTFYYELTRRPGARNGWRN